MTDTKTFQCPNCGSPLTTTGAEKEVKCPYCGSTAIVPEDLRDTSRDQSQSRAYDFGGATRTDYAASQQLDSSGGETIETKAAGGRVGCVAAVALIGVVAAIGFAVFGVSRMSSVGQQLGQSIGSPIAAFSTAVATVTPTEAIPTPVPFTKELFKDDFTSSSSGWPRARNTKYTLEYKSGQYHVLINEQGAGQEVTRTGEKNYSDVSVEVDVQQTAGPSDGLMGVTCRNDDNGNFYSFEISQDGTYGIYKYTKDNGDSLDEETLDPNTIHQGDLNHVEGICQGDTLTLLVNGQVLSQVQDSSYTKGEVGMLVRTGSSGDPGEDVVFSHLVVKGP